MPRTLLTLLLFLSQMYLFAQQAAPAPVPAVPDNLTYSTVGISTYIKEHFSSDTARIRAIFVWVANNINYDIERFLARKNSDYVSQPVTDVLKTRLAICRGYADLFNELCTLCNIKSMVISGYTKQKGIVSTVSHAWVAAELEHKWWFFDPTWAAGYVRDNKFTKGYSNTYYQVAPDQMVKDHMPFDPLYQLLEHPFTNREFIDGMAPASKGKPGFNYIDSLQQFSLLGREDKIRNELRRIQNNGIENDLIKEQFDYLKKTTEYYSSKNSYDQAMDIFRHAIELFNQYIADKNKQFSTVKESNAIKVMVDSISYHVSASWNVLGTAVAKDAAGRQSISKAFQDLEKFQNRINQEKDFVTKYLSMDVSSRSQLFYKKQD